MQEAWLSASLTCQTQLTQPREGRCQAFPKGEEGITESGYFFESAKLESRANSPHSQTRHLLINTPPYRQICTKVLVKCILQKSYVWFSLLHWKAYPYIPLPITIGVPLCQISTVYVWGRFLRSLLFKMQTGQRVKTPEAEPTVTSGWPLKYLLFHDSLVQRWTGSDGNQTSRQTEK